MVSGPEERVPVGEKEQNRQRRKDRPAQRQDDTPVDAEVAGAVDDRRFLQFARNREIELAQQEDAERVEDRGHDEAGVAVQQPQGSRENEEGDDDDRLRDEESREHGEKNDVAAWKPQSRQRVSGHRMKRQRDDGDDGGDEERVPKIAEEVDLSEDVDEAVEGRAMGNEI